METNQRTTLSESGEIPMTILNENCADGRVRTLKERLNGLGYDCGEGDFYDRRTTWAVRWFCRKNGLPDHGAVDETLWNAIFASDAVRGVMDSFQYYSMEDPLWADYPYDAANTPEVEVMSNSACGPTSMAMALSTALGRAILPPVLADWSNAHGFRDPDGIHGTDESFFPACAALYGMRTCQTPLTDAAGFIRAAADLDAGRILISNVVPGSPFTKYGHYNLIERFEDGRVKICDPVPKNMALPAYTVDQWLEGGWARYYIAVYHA